MPSVSDPQRKFMGAELARKRSGKKTQTGMSEGQLSDFASKKETKNKPGRSLVDVEFHEKADKSRVVDDAFVHPLHKGYGKGGDDPGLESKGAITWGALDPPSIDGDAPQFTKGSQSCNRDIGQGIHYGAPVNDRGPETEFRVEEINPQHYGRDYEPSPYKDLFKTGYKSRELNIRNEADLCYQDCETPGAVTGEYESSIAYGTTSYKKVPVELEDNRTYSRQQKYARENHEFDERDDDDKDEKEHKHR